VHDRVDAGCGRGDRGQVADVSGDELLTRVCRAELGEVEQAQDAEASLEPLAEGSPDPAGGSGN
jgi:hypothetical protein